MLRAKTTFFAPGRRIVAGDLVADDDPLVAGRERLFERLNVPAPVKAGTGDEKRPSRGRPSKKTAPKAASGGDAS